MIMIIMMATMMVMRIRTPLSLVVKTARMGRR